METGKDYVEHLEELRWRIIFSLVFFVILFIISFSFIDKVALFLQEPLKGYNMKLYYFRPYEKFMTYIKVSFICSIILSLPVIIGQIGSFIWPALRKNEKKIIFWTLTSVPLVFVCGAVFAYKVMAPMAFKFFIGFSQGDNVIPMWSFGEYFDMLISFVVLSGIIFQFPLLIILLINIGIISSDTLAKYRKYIIIIIAVGAGLFSPGPDIVSQLILGIPLYLLFELSLIIGRISAKKRLVEDKKWKI